MYQHMEIRLCIAYICSLHYLLNVYSLLCFQLRLENALRWRWGCVYAQSKGLFQEVNALPANSKLEFYWQIRRNTWIARSAEQTDRALEVIVLYCWFITVFRGGVTPSIKQCHLVVESEKTVGYIQLNVLSQYQHMGIKFTHVWLKRYFDFEQ